MFCLCCVILLYIIKKIISNMSRKTINISKTVRNKIKKCKIKDTERFAEVIARLLDKYEKELLNDG